MGANGRELDKHQFLTWTSAVKVLNSAEEEQYKRREGSQENLFALDYKLFHNHRGQSSGLSKSEDNHINGTNK